MKPADSRKPRHPYRWTNYNPARLPLSGGGQTFNSMHPNLSILRTNPQSLSGLEIAQLRSDLRISLCKSVGRLAYARVVNHGIATGLAHVAANLGALLEVQIRIAEHAATNGTDCNRENTEDASQ